MVIAETGIKAGRNALWREGKVAGMHERESGESERPKPATNNKTISCTEAFLTCKALQQVELCVEKISFCCFYVAVH